ncbi:hypothetical protein KC8_10015 [Sphingomonas sp. KC8]|nr:hypothetical protein KC8_10015 [Sphingomonas sp. KC8]
MNVAGTNCGHGHVYERSDGAKARCGGPGLCGPCSRDAASVGGRVLIDISRAPSSMEQMAARWRRG